MSSPHPWAPPPPCPLRVRVLGDQRLLERSEEEELKEAGHPGDFTDHFTLMFSNLCFQQRNH